MRGGTIAGDSVLSAAAAEVEFGVDGNADEDGVVASCAVNMPAATQTIKQAVPASQVRRRGGAEIARMLVAAGWVMIWKRR